MNCKLVTRKRQLITILLLIIVLLSCSRSDKTTRTTKEDKFENLHYGQPTKIDFILTGRLVRMNDAAGCGYLYIGSVAKYDDLNT